jgi:hypothetical protein
LDALLDLQAAICDFADFGVADTQ